METRASYVLVGAFVLALAAAMLGIAVWFANIQFDQAPARYHIYFTGDVTGLNVGSPVRYRGVSVGSVADIRIDPENVERVRVRVDVGPDTPIKTDTVARTGMQGITGIAYVQLTGGTREAADLQPAEGQDIAVIESGPSVLQRITDSLPDMIDRSAEIVDRLARLFDDETQVAVSEMIRNMHSLVGAISAQQDNIGETLQRGQDTLAAMTGLMQTLESRADRLFEGGETALGGLDTAMAELRLTITEFNRVALAARQLVEENRAPLSDFTHGGLYELSQLIAEGRILMDAVTRLTREFERDPSRFLFGDTQRGFQP